MMQPENVKNNNIEVASTVNDINCVSLNNNSMKEWEPYCGRCPKCGSTHIEFQTGIMLTSNPPQLNLRCVDCGNRFFSGQLENEWSNKDSLDDMWKYDQSILNTPKIEDPLPGDSPWIPFTPDPFRLNPPTIKENYGWICPKCGRVLAPHLDSCKYCSSNSTVTDVTTVPVTLTGDIDPKELDKLKKSLATGPVILQDFNSISTTPDTPVYTISNTTVDKEVMKEKFLNESESVFEAVDKYKEWERNKEIK